jgi:hypothetical protein
MIAHRRHVESTLKRRSILAAFGEQIAGDDNRMSDKNESWQGARQGAGRLSLAKREEEEGLTPRVVARPPAFPFCRQERIKMDVRDLGEWGRGN